MCISYPCIYGNFTCCFGVLDGITGVLNALNDPTDEEALKEFNPGSALSLPWSRGERSSMVSRGTVKGEVIVPVSGERFFA